jgi:hypothetical protein
VFSSFSSFRRDALDVFHSMVQSGLFYNAIVAPLQKKWYFLQIKTAREVRLPGLQNLIVKQLQK